MPVMLAVLVMLVHEPAGNGPIGAVGLVRPAVARTATASRIPRAAVAVSGIV
jgi:hypothetical protein